MLFFVIIVLSNVAFLAAWTLYFLGEVKLVAAKNYSKIYLLVCLCGN